MVTRSEYNKAMTVVLAYQSQVFAEYDRVKDQSGQVVPLLPITMDTVLTETGLSSRVLRSVQDNCSRFGLDKDPTLKELSEIDFIKFGKMRGIGNKSQLELKLLFNRVRREDYTEKLKAVHSDSEKITTISDLESEYSEDIEKLKKKVDAGNKD